MGDGNSSFCRVLHPADPWLGQATDEDRAAHFMGAHGKTSVADRSACPSEVVMAAFYGSSRRLEPPQPVYMSFGRNEVEANGGVLQSSDADPPWPPEYNDAHHEITAGEPLVASYMAAAFARDGSRMSMLGRDVLFMQICELLGRPDRHEQFAKNSSWRLRRLFREERDLWESLAARFTFLRQDAEVQKQLRREAQ